jgi:hypothetical protein
MIIDQAGLPAGEVNVSRQDGLDTGATVTLTSTAHEKTFKFNLLWVGQHPDPDTDSVNSLVQASDSTYTFTPTSGVYGSWRIELITDAGTSKEDRQVKIFAIKESAGAIRIPAGNESSSPNATLVNGELYVNTSDFNGSETDGIFIDGTYISYWKPLADAIHSINTGGGGGGGAPTGAAGGDLGDVYPDPIVVGFQGYPISNANPTLSQSLIYNGSEWGFDYPNAAGAASGDLAGSYPNPEVVQLRGRLIGDVAPNINESLTWDGTGWVPFLIAPSGSAGGDLSGSYPNPVVAALQTFAIDPATPAFNQALIFDSAVWKPTTLTFTDNDGGDLTGSYPSPTVTRIQNIPVSSSSPQPGDVMTFDGTNWTPSAPVRRRILYRPIS